MKQITRKFIFWIPRVMCIAFALFVGMFALDTFTEPIPFRQALGGGSGSEQQEQSHSVSPMSC
ncbi:MAG: hypothetical protein VB025_04785 [Sphaerochaeta sp.]|nr:hypothetical protein [Sphaerochaeta sp.]PKL25712.1 MAG: hypothetical protein CVV46_15880 [Spirochaetae bacterium HGW-Spirochaetae-2]